MNSSLKLLRSKILIIISVLGVLTIADSAETVSSDIVLEINKQLTEDEAVADVIFSYITMATEEAREKQIIQSDKSFLGFDTIVIKYPKVLFIRDERMQTLDWRVYFTLKQILFLNFDGTVKKTLKLQRYLKDKQNQAVVSVSSAKNFIAVTEVEEFNIHGDTVKASTKVLDLNASVLWTVTHKNSRAQVSADGNSLLCSDVENPRIELFFKNGKNHTFYAAAGMSVDYSQDLKHIILLTSNLKKTEEVQQKKLEKYANLTLISNSGTIVWNMESIVSGNATGGAQVKFIDINFFKVMLKIPSPSFMCFSINGSKVESDLCKNER